MDETNVWRHKIATETIQNVKEGNRTHVLAHMVLDLIEELGEKDAEIRGIIDTASEMIPQEITYVGTQEIDTEIYLAEQAILCFLTAEKHSPRAIEELLDLDGHDARIGRIALQRLIEIEKSVIINGKLELEIVA